MIAFTRCKNLGAQSGVMLLEALIGILLFSIGILALVAMYTTSATASSDAQYRLEAANYAQRIANEMWIGSTHSDDITLAPGILSASLVQFAHQPNGTNCDFGGAASGNALVTGWVSEIEAPNAGLPGMKAQYLQIKIDTVGDVNQVSVTICWKPPSDPTGADPHRYTLVTAIQ
jgi:type IV pilus assembly protein PilV